MAAYDIHSDTATYVATPFISLIVDTETAPGNVIDLQGFQSCEILIDMMSISMAGADGTDSRGTDDYRAGTPD